jgi:two-component system LytT family response regulator
MTLRIAIVDDEPLAREGVALELESQPDVEIVAACGDGAAAIRAIRELEPDLVFLDVKMPGLSGFDVIEAVGRDRMPPVIFLTAHEEHALRAFRVDAVDYLLKPLDGAKLAEALQRARTAIARSDLAGRARDLAALLDRLGAGRDVSAGRGEQIVVRSPGSIRILKPEEIVWIAADGDYVRIHTERESHLVRESLRSMEARLEPFGFRRTHRSSLVCLRRIRELVLCDSGDYDAVLENGCRLKVGRQYKEALFRALHADG